MGIRRRIDFIVIPSSLWAFDTKAIDELDLGSDHRAVKTTIDLSASGAKYHRKKCNNQIDWEKFKEESMNKNTNNTMKNMNINKLSESLSNLAENCRRPDVEEKLYTNNHLAQLLEKSDTLGSK